MVICQKILGKFMITFYNKSNCMVVFSKVVESSLWSSVILYLFYAHGSWENVSWEH